MKRLFIATVGSAALAVGCSNVPASGNATAEGADVVAAAEPAAAENAGDVSEQPQRAAAVDRTASSSRTAPARTRERAAGPVDREPVRTAAESSAPARRVPEYREVTLPAGTVLPLTLASALASDSSAVEDAVRATLRNDLTIDDATVLPAGAELVGRVTDVERSGRVKGRARVAFRFTMLHHDGDEYDVRTEAIERVAAATKGEDAKKVGIGAGAGAALGAIIGGGSGAAKGAAIGAAAGTGAVLATRGEEVRLDAGEPVQTRLTAPLPVRVRVR